MAVVVLTRNRRKELLRTLERMTADHAGPDIYVVDNGSTDDTDEAVARAVPRVHRVRLGCNEGAAGRNRGVRACTTPYVAFCDDDTWWVPGALERACELFDAHPKLGAVTGRVLVGPEAREDPTCSYMAATGRPRSGVVPGLEEAGFLAGACIMRRDACPAAGGYEPRFFIGGEESLLALDLLAAGWHIGYVAELAVHHRPSPRRDSAGRRHLLLRNAIWCAWLRRPVGDALRESMQRVWRVRGEPHWAGSLVAAAGGLPWVLRHRRVVPAHVEAIVRRARSPAARSLRRRSDLHGAL